MSYNTSRTYKEDFRRKDNKELYEIIDILRTKKSFYIEDKINLSIINNIGGASKNFGKNVTRTSIRNIYNAFKDIEMQFNQQYVIKLSHEMNQNSQFEIEIDNRKKEAFDKIEPIIKLMKGKIKYLVDRKLDKVTNNNIKNSYYGFYDFMEESINVIDSMEEFDVFLKNFECMYGYLEKGREN